VGKYKLVVAPCAFRWHCEALGAKKGGMLSVDRSRNRRSWTILAQEFFVKVSTEPRNARTQEKPSAMERSFTELRFASFRRSMVKDPGRLSRVEMNALAGSLDSLPGSHTRPRQISARDAPCSSWGSGLKAVNLAARTGSLKNGTLTLGKSPHWENDLSPKELNQ